MQYDWNWAVAETLVREAVALTPNDATAQQWLGEFLCYTSRFDECRRQLRIAFELDPLSPVLRMQQGSPALYSGNFAAAAALYTDATRDSPDFSMGHYALGLAYVGLENWDRAIESYRLSIPDLGLAIVGGPLAYALGRNGELAEAQQTVSALEVLAESRYVPPSKIAVAYLGVGDYRRAKQELIRAIEVHDDRLVYFALDVHFRNLVAEDGFRDIASRIGF
jgi:tetratricopeptide (TPR) repeat protein